MNKLSIEEKATRYDERLEKARKWYDANTNEGYRGIFEDIFPELTESEDERIRKALVEMVHDTTGDSLWVDYNVHKEDALAWLEKQGEQKPADITNKLKEEYQKGWDAAMQQLPKEVDSQIWQIANNSAKTWEESFAILCATQKAYGKGKKDALKEYKTAWSEEDVRKMRAIVTIINSTPQSIICSIDQDRESLCNWLKFLKDRYTWKPSDEQMEDLLFAIGNLRDIGQHKAAKVVHSIYEQLKAL